MTKIYLVTSHNVNETGSLSEAFYALAFTNKKLAEAFLKFLDLSDKIAEKEPKVINKLEVFKICKLNWTKDVERLEKSIEELPY